MKIEWAGTVAFVAGLALVFASIGNRAEHRLAGDIVVENDSLSPRDTRTRNVERMNEMGAPDTDASRLCENGFFNGALQAFVQGDGEVFGERIKHVGRAALAAAPELVAALPGAAAMARDAAFDIISTWSVERTRNAAGQLVDMFFLDSIRTTHRLAIDGWHGGETLVAAAQSGDCVAFGRALRVGADHAPEMTLALLDVVPMAGSAFALGRGAAKLSRAKKLAMQASRLARATVHGTTTAALATAMNATRVATRAAQPIASAANAMGRKSASVIRSGHVSHSQLARSATEAPARTRFASTSAAPSGTARSHTLPDVARVTLKSGVAAWIAIEAVLHQTTQAALHRITNAVQRSSAHATQHGDDFLRTRLHPSSASAQLFEANDGSWWGLPFVGATRTVQEIRRRWPQLFQGPRPYIVAVWDLAQSGRSAHDVLLDTIELKLSRLVGASDAERRFAAGTLTPGHGQYLKERQSEDFLENLQRVVSGQQERLQPTDFGTPPLEYMVARESWDVLGHDLRALEIEALSLLQTHTPVVTRVARELAISSLDTIPEWKRQDYRNEIANILFAQRRFENAELSKQIAHTVTRRTSDVSLDQHLVNIANARPATFQRTAPLAAGEDVASASLNPRWEDEASDGIMDVLGKTLAEQAQAERIVRETETTFLHDLVRRDARIEVYADRAVTNFISDAHYVAWMKDETIFFVESGLYQRHVRLPDHVLSGGLLAPQDAIVVRGFGNWSEETIFEFQRVVNNWRTRTRLWP